MRSLPNTTDVVIVGAGPTGLVLASALAARGVDFVLVDRQPEGANTSRAAVVHARTLEVLEDLQVTPRLCAAGKIVRTFTLRDRDRRLASIRFDALPTPHPYTLMIPQQVTEAILLARLRELGGDVHRPFAVQDVQQDQEGVVVTLAADGAAPAAVRARYVVGADGMHSVVRERAGIDFAGGTYAPSFVLADVRMRWPLGDDEVMLFLSPAGLVVVAPLPGGRHRIVATMDQAPEHPDREVVERLLAERGPTTGRAEVEEVVWSSRFRVHHRLAARYRERRILLAGDAAHVHSPAGGQGMNTGIQDAMALGAALVAALGGGGDAPLDRYERVRRPVAQRVVAFTHRMTRMATVRAPLGRALRNTALRLVGSWPPARRWIANELAELRYR